jgi:hypothetical protein
MTTKPTLPFGDDFSYRKNRDGTFDSICLQCFATVGTGSSIEELTGREFLHTLECSQMNWLKMKKGPKSVRTAG